MKILRNTFLALLLLLATGSAYFTGRKLGAGPAALAGSLHLADAGHAVLLQNNPNITPSPNLPPAQIFASVLNHIHTDYVRNYFGDQNLSNGALEGIVTALNDPNTQYLAPVRAAAMRGAYQGSYSGIGAMLSITDEKKLDVDYDYLTVMDVAPGGPADKAGIRPGDHITYLNKHWIIAYSILADVARIQKEMGRTLVQKQAELTPIANRFQTGISLYRALRRLTEGTGTKLGITYTRQGLAKPVTVSLTTAETSVPPVAASSLPNNVQYIALRQFNPQAGKELQAALDNAGHAHGIVLDLRNNPGGVTAAPNANLDGYKMACNLLARLTRGGVEARIERHAGKTTPLIIHSAPNALHLPLVVMVNRGTAGLAEMVAAALQGSGAKLVGSRTAGDDTLSLFANLSSGAAMQITTAHLFTAGGEDLSKGLSPAIQLPSSSANPHAAVNAAAAQL